MLTVRLLIVHHQRLFADVLSRSLAKAGFTSVTTATTLAEIEDAVRVEPPDVAVVDGTSASPLASSVPLHALFSPARTRIIAMVEDPSGPEGVLLGPGYHGVTRAATDGVDELVQDIAAVARGHAIDRDTHLAPAGTRAHATSHIVAARSRLTRRELDVLACLVDGADNRRIALALSIRPNTVRTHVQNILMKLGVRSRLEAVTFAARHGLATTVDREHVRPVA